MDEAAFFLVRVWYGQSGFRASARRLEEEEAHLFGAPDELALYLALVAPAAPAAPAGTARRHAHTDGDSA